MLTNATCAEPQAQVVPLGMVLQLGTLQKIGVQKNGVQTLLLVQARHESRL